MRVIVATDGSPCADIAVDLAAGIGWPEGTSFRVVQAVESGAGLYGNMYAAELLAQSASLEEDLRRDAAETVARTAARLRAAGYDASGDVLRGRPAAAIVEAARSDGADLIIVGSRGHGAIERMLLGSVSAEIVDHSPIPVLVAREAGFTRVVLAWDGSAAASGAARLVREWPIFAGTTVRVVSVTDIETPWWAGFPVPGTVESTALYLESADAVRKQHEELARTMAAELVAAHIDATAEPREGDAATELLRAAAPGATDVIVMGTHGRTGLARVLLGSVARNVLHHATCSVLIAPDPSHRS